MQVQVYCEDVYSCPHPSTSYGDHESSDDTNNSTTMTRVASIKMVASGNFCYSTVLYFAKFGWIFLDQCCFTSYFSIYFFHIHFPWLEFVELIGTRDFLITAMASGNPL